ncbi:hypothetical protein LTR08_004717 [Meristemomyces frigidus]|nr:hypothetical protein LTR08_004717 [Meristemomyces frigidus]
MAIKKLLSPILLLLGCAYAQLQSQNNTFNSTFRLTSQQIKAANLSETTAHNVEVALNFERSNNAGSLTQDDPFYVLPKDYDYANPPPPGTVLKVEEHTNISLYTLPMGLSMSRILYSSEALNGSSVPASAYVLWPYLPRTFSKLTPYSDTNSSGQALFPVVALAHGTSGQTTACAPSNLRGLWDDFHEPFAIALAGYAVVAPDYVGLGVAEISTYFILPAHANDVFHGVAAAQKAWPDQLSQEFVVAGQSQGGAVAWASAQRQAKRPVKGYLGTMAASPFTNVLADISADAMAENNARVVGIAQGLNSVLPTFSLSDWLTDAGIARWKLLHEIQGCGATGGQLFNTGARTVPILRDGWNTSEAAMWFSNVTTNGGRPFAGPMLVLQGTDDPNANEPVTTLSVNKTCAMYPDNQLEYIRWENITHVPVLYAGQHLWLDWIRDRFAGVEAPKGCSTQTMKPPSRINGAGFKGWASQTWFLEYDVYGI